jgi:predicted nucleic acid-binding protein
MAVLLDSSVVIDLLNLASPWRAWTAATLKRVRRTEALCINQVVLAECLAGPTPLPARVFERFERRALPWEAASLAGPAQGAYRRRGGAKDTILADFLIGAHAAAENLALLTRDPRRIAIAFPSVRLITPETEPL